jgi:multiple sugar transport system permease protein
MTVAFTLGLWNVWRSFSRAAAPFRSERTNWRKYTWGYALLLPALGLMAWWAYIPLGIGLSISFLDYQLVRDNVWMGIDNFANILFDDKFWYPLFRTFYFVAVTIGLGFLAADPAGDHASGDPDCDGEVCLPDNLLPSCGRQWARGHVPLEADVRSNAVRDPQPNPADVQLARPRGRNDREARAGGLWLSLIVTLIWLPIKVDEMGGGMKLMLWGAGIVLIVVTILSMTSQPLSEMYHAGKGFKIDWRAFGTTIKSLVGSFDVKPLKWAQDPALAMLCVVIPSVWAASGPGTILYLAALKSIPDDYYEAADIDGASHWHKGVLHRAAGTAISHHRAVHRRGDRRVQRRR